LGLVACNKSETALNTPEQKFIQKTDLSSFNNGNRIFTDEQSDSIGFYHNKAVIELVEDFNFNSENLYSEFVKQVSQFDISPMELVQLPDGVSILDYYDEVLKANLSENAHAFIYEIANNCVDFNSVNDVAQYVELNKSYAKKIFKGAELDVVFTALTVFEHSSQLWFSEESGGKGLGEIFINNIYQNKNTGTTKAPYKMPAAQREALKKCLIADGTGAAAAAAAVWEGGFVLTVPGLVALLCQAGIGSALASYSMMYAILVRGEYVIAPTDNRNFDMVIKWQDNIIVEGKVVTLPLTNPYFSDNK
jgi:hypothetical protein